MSGTALYIGGFELPNKNAASHRVVNNAKILHSLGYSISFIGITHDHNIANTSNVTKGFSYISLEYPETIRQWVHYVTNIAHIINVIEFIGNVDLVICYNYPALAMRKLISYCRQKHIIIIGDCTEWYAASSENFAKLVITWLDITYRMRVVHKMLDGLIVISEYLNDYYSHIPTLILPPLVDSEDKIWTGCCSKNNNKTLVYVGTLGSHDRINTFLNTLSRIKCTFSFKIVGITENQYRSMYPTDYQNVKNDERFCFMGRLPHDEAIKIMKSADYSCILRTDNRVTKAGFPTKFVESISCGVPVLTNAISNVSAFINNGVNGYVLSDDENTMFNQLSMLLANENMNIKVDNRKLFDFRNYVLETKVFLDSVSVKAGKK